MEKTNVQMSGLVNKETCTSCGFCCKSLTLWIPDAEGLSTRVNYLDKNDITFFKTGIFKDNIEWIIIKIETPCPHLNDTNGKYQCLIWTDDSKPNMCRTYPSNQFFDFERIISFKSTSYIEKTLEVVKKICPALSNTSVHDVIKDQSDIMKKLRDK